MTARGAGTLLSAALALLGCGGSLAQSPQPPARAVDISPISARLLRAHACTRMRGSFLPIDMEGVSGTAFVDHCRQLATMGPELHIVAGGILWDGGALEPAGVYLNRPIVSSFEVDVAMQVRGAYVPGAKRVALSGMATVPVRAALTVVGPIELQPSMLLTQALAGLRPLEDEARRVIAVDGAAKLRARLEEGITVVFDIEHLQPDVALGQVPLGMLPAKPRAWPGPTLVNEQVTMGGRGFVVRGPFAPTEQALIDVIDGRGDATLAMTCAREFEGLAAAGRAGGHAALEAVVGAVSAQKSRVPLRMIGVQQRLAPPPCEWVVLIWSSNQQRVSGSVVIAALGG